MRRSGGTARPASCATPKAREWRLSALSAIRLRPLQPKHRDDEPLPVGEVVVPQWLAVGTAVWCYTAWSCLYSVRHAAIPRRLMGVRHSTRSSSMLDRAVRQTLLKYQAGQTTLEDAAHALLEVRRRTGCLSLLTPSDADERGRALGARFNELVAREFGAR
jgi:hypothetical protein